MASEYPITDEQMDAIADAALGLGDEASDVPTMGATSDGSGDETGFRASMREVARRHRLLAAAPNVRDALSARRKKAFLRALSTTGNVTAASAAAGWGKGIAYSLRKADPDFAQSWEWAVEVAAGELELEARRRAVHGVQKGVYGSLGAGLGNGLIATETAYSDGLLTLLLKGNMRDKYGDKVDATVTNRGGVLVVPAAPSSTADWESAARAGQSKFREQEE